MEKYKSGSIVLGQVFVLLGLCSCAGLKGEKALLLNVPYQDARPVVLQNGWQPLASKYAEFEMDSRASYFYRLGYAEVDSCSGTGAGYCAFHFKNENGLFLIVTTQETISGHDISNVDNRHHAMVVNYSIAGKL